MRFEIFSYHSYKWDFDYRKIADKLTQLPISEIRISMYGTKEFHDRFVGIEGAFDKSLHALQKLNEKKEKFLYGKQCCYK